MRGKMKVNCVALVAVTVMSWATASPAHAAWHHISVPTAPAIITASSEAGEESQFTFTTSVETTKIFCEKVVLEGTAAEQTNRELTFTPTFTSCFRWTPFEELESVTVKVNHCGMILKGETNESGYARIELECAVENELTIELPKKKCTLHLTPQMPNNGVSYSAETDEETGKKDITVKLNAEGVRYKQTGGTNCKGLLGNFFGNGEDGVFEGNFTAQAYKEKAEGCFSPLTGTEKTTPGSHYNSCESQDQDLELNENVTF
jgi:hypothetical protein